MIVATSYSWRNYCYFWKFKQKLLFLKNYKSLKDYILLKIIIKWCESAIELLELIGELLELTRKLLELTREQELK